MKILFFAGSLRKDSLNKKLARIASQIAEAQDGIEAMLVDLTDYEIPVYSGDIESRGIPQSVTQLSKEIAASDAVVISSPEYNGGIASPLKNTLDWVSRVKPIAFDKKPMLLLSASPGSLGGVRGLWHTRVPFEVVGTLVYPDMFGLALADTAFDESGGASHPKFKEAKQTDRLTRVLTQFLDYVRRLQRDRRDSN